MLLQPCAICLIILVALYIKILRQSVKSLYVIFLLLIHETKYDTSTVILDRSKYMSI